jgi:hypothetical protein
MLLGLLDHPTMTTSPTVTVSVQATQQEGSVSRVTIVHVAQMNPFYARRVATAALLAWLMLLETVLLGITVLVVPQSPILRMVSLVMSVHKADIVVRQYISLVRYDLHSQ